MYFVGGYYDQTIFEGYEDISFKDPKIYSLNEVMELPFLDGVKDVYNMQYKEDDDKEWEELSEKEKSKIILEYVNTDTLAGLFMFSSLKDSTGKLDEILDTLDYCWKTHQFSHLKDNEYNGHFRVCTLNVGDIEAYFSEKEHEEELYLNFLSNIEDLFKKSSSKIISKDIAHVNGNFLINLSLAKDKENIRFEFLIKKDILNDFYKPSKWVETDFEPLYIGTVNQLNFKEKITKKYIVFLKSLMEDIGDEISKIRADYKHSLF